MNSLSKTLRFHSLEVAQHYDNPALVVVLDEAANVIDRLKSEVEVLKEQVAYVSRKYIDSKSQEIA